jgi:hypothetical protein
MTEAVEMQCAIVELRHYTLHPGRRDDLIELFEREFLETQEAVGMTLLGQFRVLGQDDRFVWLRGFPDMEARAAALAAFYDGPVWVAHREAANATMIDSDNVLLLRPARAGSGFAAQDGAPFPSGGDEPSGRVYLAGVFYLGEPAEEEDVTRIEASIAPAVIAGGSILAWYVSEQTPNTYPRLPVREGENAVVWFVVFSDAAKVEQCLAALPRVDRLETIKLAPTPRSRLQ